MIPKQIKEQQMHFIAKMMNEQNVPASFISELIIYAMNYDHFYDLARAWVCEPDLNQKLRIIEILNDTFLSIKTDANLYLALKNNNIL